jgi:hypothetical protein
MSPVHPFRALMQFRPVASPVPRLEELYRAPVLEAYGMTEPAIR